MRRWPRYSCKTKKTPIELCNKKKLKFTKTLSILSVWECSEAEPPEEVAGDGWRAVVMPPYRSANALALGGEPPFTTLSHQRGMDPFEGTLDYIFLSRHWKVLGVSLNPAMLLGLKVGGIIPNGKEPSDHLLISANLQLAAA